MLKSPIVARWAGWSGEGAQQLVLRRDADRIVAEGVILSDPAEAFAARYRIEADPGWRVRAVEVAVLGGPSLVLSADGRGDWRDGDGNPLDPLRGAIDVDLSASPFTNTLPIRRLDPAAGTAVEIRVAYVDFPSLALTADPQRYTCLEHGRRYRYESLDSDFVREIEVDGDAIVVSYPDLFRRTL